MDRLPKDRAARPLAPVSFIFIPRQVATMKEVINLAGPTVKIVDSPVPEPNDDQVLIKVVVSGSNPKDWKCPDLAEVPGSLILQMYPRLSEGVNQGDDIAGIVEKVGKNVYEFKV